LFKSKILARWKKEITRWTFIPQRCENKTRNCIVEEDPLKREEKNMRRLRFIVNITQAVLTQSDLTLQEALDLTENTRKAVLNLFPGKDFVYDLIYTPRFRRIIEERFTIPGSMSSRN